MKRSTPQHAKRIAASAAVFCLLFVTPKVRAQWSQMGGTDTSTAKVLITPLTSDAKGNVYANVFGNNASYIAKWDGKIWNKLGNSNNVPQSESIITDVHCNVYVVEGYKDAHEISHNHVAKWNGKKWAQLGGINDTTFNNKFIKSIAVDNYGSVYAAVLVEVYSSKKFIRRYSYVVKWDSKVWSIVGGRDGFTFNDGNTNINTIIADGVGNLYAAGSLNNDRNGQNSFVAKWDGRAWGDLGNSRKTLHGSLESIITDTNGNIYAVLAFGTMIPVQYIAKWDGQQWSQLVNKSAPRFGGLCSSITADAAGGVYAAVIGMNYQTGQPKKNYVARWDGAAWKELSEGEESPFNNRKNKFGGMIKIFANAKGDLTALGTFYNENGKYYLAEYKQ